MMPSPCALLLVATVGVSTLSSVDFSAQVPLRRSIETTSIEHTCQPAYQLVPLARRMPFGEVQDEILAPKARLFYERYVQDYVGWPSLADYATATRANRVDRSVIDAYARAAKRLRDEDQARLSDLLIDLGRIEDGGAFEVYGACLRRALIQRLRQLPDDSHYALRPAMIIRDLEPEPRPKD